MRESGKRATERVSRESAGDAEKGMEWQDENQVDSVPEDEMRGRAS